MSAGAVQQRTMLDEGVSAPPLIDVQGVSVHFPVGNSKLFSRDKSVVRAVDGVDLAVRSGETMGLVGESGCGKSTLGRAILQLPPPTAGSVQYDGIELTTMDSKELRQMRRKLQVVHQDPYTSLNPRMTIGSALAEAISVHRLANTRADISRRVDTLLDSVGLTPHVRGRYPYEFSGGQRQRVGIARALAVEPRFIVADEAVSALDVSIQAQIVELFAQLQRDLSLTYLFISHDLAVVRSLAHRVAVMYLGKIVEVGDVEDVFRNPRHPYTEALLSAVPVPDPVREQTRQRIILKGDVPSPLAVPSGCRFRTRCIRAQSLCEKVEPGLLQDDKGHAVACHFPVEPATSVLAKA